MFCLDLNIIVFYLMKIVLTNPSSFNTSLPNFLRHSTSRSYRPIRLRQNAAYTSYQNYLINHHQDSNNNVAYYDITANFDQYDNINDENIAENFNFRKIFF